MHTKISQDTRRWQGMVSTGLLVSAWLYGNISSLKLLFESFVQASSLNLMLIGLVVAILLVQLVRHRVETSYFASLQVSATPVLKPYPLLLMLGSAVSAIALQWLVDIPHIALLLFALGTYGLCGLFLAPDSWRKGLPVAILIACILPFSSQVTSGLGLPARLLTAHAVEQMLWAWHVAAISSQDIIVLENGIAHVDLPCSGLKSLWTGTLFLLAVTWLECRLVGVRWLLVCALNLFLQVSANTVRVLLLVVITHVLKQPQIATLLHVPLGLLGFICACALTWAMLQSVPKHSDFRFSLPPFSKGGLGGLDFGLGDTAENPESMEIDHKPNNPKSIAAQDKQPKSIKLNKQPNNPKSNPPLPPTPPPTAPPRTPGGKGGCQNGKSILLVVFVIALALIAQLHPPQEEPLSIASLHWPQQMVSERIPLTEAEQRTFDNPRTAAPEKLRFVFGNLSGSMLLVASTSWGTHHSPELCLLLNGLKVDQIERKHLTPNVLARWLSLQDGKLSATYWLQSSQQTTDDFFSRIWSDVTRRQKTWVLVSVLFESLHSSDNPEIRAFATTIHNVIDHSFKQARAQGLLGKSIQPSTSNLQPTLRATTFNSFPIQN